MKNLRDIRRFNDLVYDVGMNSGQDTEFYLKKGFRVVGFEANPELVKQNQARFLCAIESNRLVIVEGAIVEDVAQEKIQFFKNLDNDQWSTVNNSWACRGEKLGTHFQMIEVNTINFCSCLEQFGIPYYMKIDIEGAELTCLKQLIEFELRPFYVSIEAEKACYDRLCNEINLLDELGYNLFMAVQQGTVHRTKLTNAVEGNSVAHRFTKGSSGPFGRDLEGTWKSKDDILRVYESVFPKYQKYGDDTFWQLNRYTNMFLRVLSIITHRQLPGWYDTHARHSSWSS